MKIFKSIDADYIPVENGKNVRGQKIVWLTN